MKLTRREFLKTLGDSCLLYTFCLIPGSGKPKVYRQSWPSDLEEIDCRAYDLIYDYHECIVFHENGRVTLFCGRTELGQGLTTVLYALVTQALDIPLDKLTVILGNTDLCPDHGPTVGSAATELVAWGIWKACLEIRSDLIRQAAKTQGVSPTSLTYKKGKMYYKNSPDKTIKLQDIGKEKITHMSLDPLHAATENKTYKDLGLYNVNAQTIVTGTQKFAGDLKLLGMFYADWKIPPYHPRQTRLNSYDLLEAQSVPGVDRVEALSGRVVAVAKRYHDVVKALSKVSANWTVPERSKEHQVEEEIRSRAKLVRVIEQTGDVNSGLAASYKVVSETYKTHYTTWAQIETDTALAKTENNGNEVFIWSGSQWPHHARKKVAEYLKLPETSIHFIHTPVGGCFGGKVSPPVCHEAAHLSRKFGMPIKMVYSRKNQFQRRGLYKMACVLDLSTGVGTDGRILASKIDIFQDLGEGTHETYLSPHTLIRHFKSEMPFDQGNSRGTSYVQIRFAAESHMDMVAVASGYDPFEFRCINVQLRLFIPLIEACAEMIRHPRPRLKPDEGIGIAICNHGGRQMGAVAANVKIDRFTGKVKVKQICAAFDIGTIINHRTVTACLRGGIIMGLGYVLQEEIKLDGHGCYTEHFMDYHLPRFSDVPPIYIRFLNNQSPGSPRGCGELPVVPTVGAIANAIYNAIGVRFYSTPITPERILKALGKA